MPLYCQENEAWIYDRGATRRLFKIDPMTSIRWNRVRDDISGALAQTNEPGMCRQIKERVEPHRHEMVVFRGGQRVWEGPVTRVSLNRTGVEVEAKDVMHYAKFTAARDEHNNSYPAIVSTIDRAVALLSEMGRKEVLDPPINVLQHVRTYRTGDDARTSRVTLPYEMTVFDDIDSMAHYGGLDYTVVGRMIILFDTHTIFYTTKTVTENDFLGDLLVTWYGEEHATHAAVTSQSGVYGAVGQNDPYYGEWEIVDNAYWEEGSQEPTREALMSQARRNLDGRNPVPLHVRVPDNSQLNPNGVLSIEELVPGVRIPLRATLVGVEVSQMQKLNTVTVEEDGESGERISVELYPASSSDLPVEDTEDGE